MTSTETPRTIPIISVAIGERSLKTSPRTAVVEATKFEGKARIANIIF